MNRLDKIDHNWFLHRLFTTISSLKIVQNTEKGFKRPRKSWKWFFSIRFPGNCFEFGIIWNDFESATIWAIQIQVSFPGILVINIRNSAYIWPKLDLKMTLNDPTVYVFILAFRVEMFSFKIIKIHIIYSYIIDVDVTGSCPKTCPD